jgi:hypothetical protein
LAVRSEGGMGREERLALEQAIEDNELISLRVLNSPFPDQRARAILSYAESNSLVEFLIQEHGTEKFAQLLQTFSVGAHYDDAMLEVYGVDMNGIEDQWRAYIGAEPRAEAQAATATPSPTPTLTPQATTADTTPAVQATASPTVAPTETPVATPILPIAATATALAAQPQPTTTPVPEDPGEDASSLPAPCLGLLPALALLVILALYRPRPAL